jgi:DNA repair ATPase RecN
MKGKMFMALREMLLEEQARLENIKEIVQERLKSAPEGTLRLSNSHNYFQYYHCTDENKLGKYIVKGQEELIRSLAQKSYDEKVLRLAEKRMKQIKKITKDYQDDEIEQILSQFANKQNVYSENLRLYTSPEVLKPIMEQCLSVAVENARTRANALASGDNKRAGELISVSYNTSANDSVAPTNGLLRTKMVMAASVADTSATGTIVSRDTDVSVSVSAVFEIK